MDKNLQQKEKKQQTNTNYSLTQVLTFLIQKLSNLSTQNYTKQHILIKLLQKIDPTYFQYKFLSQQTYDYEAITKGIVDYYNDKRYEKIKKIFLIQCNYVRKFQHIFQLVLDLAIMCNQWQKQRYIQEIIGMDDREKEILMPYFDQVLKRKFVQSLSQFKKYVDTNQVQHTEQDQLLQLKDQQYQQLKQNFQQIYRIYNQLLQNHNSLKVSFQKILNQNSQIVQQKYQLMNQLGIHPSSNFLQISQKYKRDLKQYQIYIQKLSKDVEQKNLQLKSKQNQIKQITTTFTNSSIWQKQKNILQQKSNKLQNQLKILEQRQNKLRDELDRSQGIIAKLKDDISQKDKQIDCLARFKNRYKGIKQVHFQFKRNFVERMKQS